MNAPTIEDKVARLDEPARSYVLEVIDLLADQADELQAIAEEAAALKPAISDLAGRARACFRVFDQASNEACEYLSSAPSVIRARGAIMELVNGLERGLGEGIEEGA